MCACVFTTCWPDVMLNRCAPASVDAWIFVITTTLIRGTSRVLPSRGGCVSFYPSRGSARAPPGPAKFTRVTSQFYELQVLPVTGRCRRCARGPVRPRVFFCA